jgi:hypothetical protein
LFLPLAFALFFGSLAATTAAYLPQRIGEQRG